MRDSYSPRSRPVQSPNTSLQLRSMPASPSRAEGNRLLKRPPFSPTNPRNMPNRTSTPTAEDDPRKIGNAVKSSRAAPPTPEDRMPLRSGSQRSLSRGRLMEGPTTDGWYGDHASWASVNDDDVAWLVPTAKGNKNSIPSPIRWGQRSRSTGDNKPFQNSDRWRLGAGGSADSGERSLYDDEGEKIVTSRHKSSTGLSRTATGPLGSPLRPIVATGTVPDGSVSRPIALLDCVDVLDEREKDVLQQAARKKLPISAIDIHSRNSSTDLRGLDVLQAAAQQRPNSGGAVPCLNESPVANIPMVVEDNSGKIVTTPKKGIMGFFRGGVLGGGKRSEAKKRNKSHGHEVLIESPSSLTPVPKPKMDVNASSTLSSKRPSPLNVWAAVTEKPKLSARSKSPANMWTALNDSYEETGGLWDNTKSESAADIKAAVIHTEISTSMTSNSNPLKSDIVFGRGSLMDGQGHACFTETNDDGTTVSGVTNPTFYPDDNPMKAIRKLKAPSIMSKSIEGSLNGSFPVLSSLPQSTLLELSGDDFSDPFFPNGTDEVAKEESGVSEAPDPELDHVEINTDNESDDDVTPSRATSFRNRHTLSNRTVASKDRKSSTVLPKNIKVEKGSPADMLIHSQGAGRMGVPMQNDGISTNMARKVRERNRKPHTLKRHEMKDGTENISGMITSVETRAPVIVPPATIVSMRVAAMEMKPTEPALSQSKRASSFRRSIIRTRGSATAVSSSELQPREPPKVIQTLNHSKSQDSKNLEASLRVNTMSSSEDLSQNIGKSQIHRSDLSISSVGSDIQRLRSILRRSRLQGDSEKVRYIEPLESAFATYDEKQIKDPMQRAGLRLLSAAVIPIQSAVRRHLAFRTALVRMWAIVTIQAAVRRWMVRYDEFRWATIKLQSLYRGGKVRDQILLEHCCAIEIQRHVRGLIASWYVYDELYKVTLVQACVRRKLAIDHAMDRMVAVIQIQSYCRGFLIRNRRNRLIAAVTCVQTSWRAFSCRFNYQLDLLDIIIVQSIWRKQSALIKYKKLQHEHQIRCAVKIQSLWRSYDCSMNYLHFIADVLVTQSVVRRWIAIKLCNKIRNENALVIQTAVRAFQARHLLCQIKSSILIQSAYRGFVCYADYMFTISDIVLVQSVARRWIKQKDFPKRLHDYKSNAAITIQKHWRGFFQASDYYVMLQEKKAAIVIQSAWRRFVHFSVFILAIDSVIRIQTAFRGYMAHIGLIRKFEAAVIIQCAFRTSMAKMRTGIAQVAHELFVASTKLSDQQRSVTLDLQRVFRGVLVRDAVDLYIKARSIQAAWRGCASRAVFDRHLKARSIQSVWRRHVALVDFDLYKRARSIQTEWRCYICRSTFLLYMKVRSIQAVWRGYIARSSYNAYLKARSIQCAWRRYSARQALCEEFQARSIQSLWHGYVVRRDVKSYRAARKIQSAWRGYVIRATMKQYILARSIQAAWRGYLIRWSYKEYIAARVIQSSWRRQTAQRCLYTHFEARVIQSWWRCRAQCKKFNYLREYVNATRIQAFCRCKLMSKAYLRFLAARRIQTAWRGTTVSRAYRYFVSVRSIQALWRGKVVHRAYRQFVSARRIQSVWRGRSILAVYKCYLAARCIQALWRGTTICKAYNKYISARRVQAVWRGKAVFRAYREYLMARRIQTFWRCKTMCLALSKYRENCEVRYRVYYAVCRMQALWRKKSLETAFMQYIAARRVQTFWRARTVYNSYELYRADRKERRLQFLAAQKIQAQWRRSTLSRAYTSFQEARSVRYAYNSSAVRIQSSWRAASLHKAFTQYIASRNIQATWRGKLIRSAYVQFTACRCIQTAWRCAILRSAYKQYIAARRIQTAWRCKFFRAAYLEFFAARRIQWHWRKFTSSRSESTLSETGLEEAAATSIAAVWRSFSVRQQYWHVLGSAIEIQTVVRGWIARRRLQELRDSAVILLRTVQSIKSKSLALNYRQSRRHLDRSPESPNEMDWEKQRADAAARTIQRFFLMVKAEVDRAVRSQKKRRRARKKLKKKRDIYDEKLLEDVWSSILQNDDVKHAEHVRNVKDSFAEPLCYANFASLLTKGSEDSRISLGRETLQSLASGRLVVAPHLVSSFGLPDHDSVARPKQVPRSRMSSMSAHEMNEDFLLEEAWIDSKICHAKERRGHRVIDPYQSRDKPSLPPTLPPSSRRHTADRRPPRRAQEV